MIHMLLEIFKSYPYTQKRLIVGLLLVLLVGGMGIRTIIASDMKNLKNQKALYSDVVKRDKELSQAAPLQTQIAAYSNQLSKTKEPDWMIQTVQKAAGDAGLSLVAVTPQDFIKEGDFEKLFLSVEGDGSYHQVGKFMEVIENHTPFIFLSQMRLEKNVIAGKTADHLRIFLVLNAYHESSGCSQ